VHVISDVTADGALQSHVVAACEVRYVIRRCHGNGKLACATTVSERELDNL